MFALLGVERATLKYSVWKAMAAGGKYA